jgi:hypothetical protein
VPNTYLSKSPTRPGLGGAWMRLAFGGVDEFVEFFAHQGAMPFLVLAAIGAWCGGRPAALVAAAFVGGGFFFAKFAGGDWMAGYRFLVPVLPLYLLLAIEGLRQIRGRIAAPPAASRLAVAGLLVALGLFDLWGSLEFHLNRGRYPHFVMTGEDMATAGRWIGERYPPETRIVTNRIGALAYYSGIRVIDKWGLTDRVIGGLRYRGGYSSQSLWEYIGPLEPELLLSGRRRDAVPGLKLVHGFPYRPVQVFPQGRDQVWVLLERVRSESPALGERPGPQGEGETAR